MLCDPQFTTKTFVSQSEAEAMIGKEVKVVSGPFKGSKGKLVRKSKQYYFLKVIIGVCAPLHFCFFCITFVKMYIAVCMLWRDSVICLE